MTSSTEDQKEKEIIDKTATDEVERLKNIESQNNIIKQSLDGYTARLQHYDQIFARISAFLDEVLKANARTTYLVTMAKDIIDSRNVQQQQ